MPEFTLRIDGQEQKVDAAPDTPLFRMIGDTLNLTGTKFDCGQALCRNVKVENGRIAQINFGDYQPVRGPEAPTIEAHFVKSSEVGTAIAQPPGPPFAPALCGSICAATRNRIRSLSLPPS